MSPLLLSIREKLRFGLLYYFHTKSAPFVTQYIIPMYSLLTTKVLLKRLKSKKNQFGFMKIILLQNGKVEIRLMKNNSSSKGGVVEILSLV